MSQQSANKFNELISDIHTYNTKNDVMTDAVNATLTTEGDNQFILQNIKGTDLVAQLTSIPIAADPDRGIESSGVENVQFQPLGIAVHKNIAYIISGQFDINGTFVTGEIGTYPSPNWVGDPSITSGPNTGINGTISSGLLTNQDYLNLLPIYQPLHNFIGYFDHFSLLTTLPPGTDILGNDLYHRYPFRSEDLKFSIDKLIEIELQESYDNSINIIFTDFTNTLRLVNSRFALNDTGNKAALANRRQTKDTNTYNYNEFLNTKLLKSSNIIPTLDFSKFNGNGVKDGGNLPGGSYRLYFAYADSDGSTTNIVEESRLVSIGYSTYGANPAENSGKYMQFHMSNLDLKFDSVIVYYSYSAGDSASASTLYRIENTFTIAGDSMYIRLYGNEKVVSIDNSEINLDYSSIDSVKSITQHDDRLILGYTKNNAISFDKLRELSSLIVIGETDRPLQIKGLGKGYADPDNVYHNLGVWAGETYEVAIVYILTEGRGNTPAFPCRGTDNYEGTANYDPNIFNMYGGNTNTHPCIITNNDGFLTVDSNGLTVGAPGSVIVPFKENRLGIYRTNKEKEISIKHSGVWSAGNVNPYTGLVDSDYDAYETHSTMIRYLTVNQDILINPASPYRVFLDTEVEGFFYVRKERKKDCIAQGYITNAMSVRLQPLTAPTSPAYHFGTSPTGDVPDSNSFADHSAMDINDVIGKQTAERIIPAPGRMIELGTSERSDKYFVDGSPGTYLYWPQPTPYSLTLQGRLGLDPQYDDLNDRYYAFYTPDALSDPAYFASIFNNSEKGIALNAHSVNMRAILDPVAQPLVTELDLLASGFKFSPISPTGKFDTTDYSNKYFSYVNEYQDIYTPKQFASICSRNIYVYASRFAVPSSVNQYGLGPSTGSGHYTIKNMERGLSIADGIRFSDYIGLRISASTLTINAPIPTNTTLIYQLWHALKNDDSTVSNFHGRGDARYSLSGGSFAWDPPVAEANFRARMKNIRFAVQANIYDSALGVIPYNGDLWKNKYLNSDESSYTAISNRMPLDNSTPLSLALTGGDCYINFTYKRAWYGLGIDGVPTASDPSLYTEYNKETGLFAKGMVFPIVCESNHNTALRSFKEADPLEYGLYGKNRTFYPIDSKSAIRNTRQLESKGYNFGYDAVQSEKSYFNLNDNAPSINTEYNTRILLSSPSISGSFKNGYNDFSGLNFKDYTKHLGPISRVISQAGTLFCIQENGVSVVPMNQRTMVSPQQGGVYIDDGQLLGQKLQIISSAYGSDQQFSVIKTDTTIYGCSFSKNKIWKIDGAKDAYRLNLISDFKVQKILNKFKKRCLKNLEKGYKPFVKASFDRRTSNVIFTYYVIHKDTYLTDDIETISSTEKFSKKIGSICYNELLEKWVTTYSWDPMYMFNLGNELYSFNSKKDKGKIWKHFADTSSTPTCKMYGQQEKFEFEFVIVENSLIQKVLNSLIVVCNREFPGRTILTIDKDVDYDSTGLTFDTRNSSYTELLKQRHEEFKYTILSNIGTALLFDNMSIEEANRLEGASFEWSGDVYVIGSSNVNSLNQINMKILNNSLNIITIPTGFSIGMLNFGLIKQNMEYIEDHLYIEIGKNDREVVINDDGLLLKSTDYSLIRDKAISVRIIYEGMNYVTIQQIVSLFDYSFS